MLPTNWQLENVNCGFAGHADQVVVPMKVQFEKLAPALSPESAVIPAPELLENSQPAKLRFRIVRFSASISTPAPGALLRPPRPV
jgi:hypothetical protein